MVYSLEEIKERIKPVAEKYGIPAIYIFGSYAREDATDDSDVDLLIDTTGVKGFFVIGGIYNDLEEALGKPIDMVTLGAFNQSSDLDFVSRVLKDRRLIYECFRERSSNSETYIRAL